MCREGRDSTKRDQLESEVRFHSQLHASFADLKTSEPRVFLF